MPSKVEFSSEQNGIRLFWTTKTLIIYRIQKQHCQASQTTICFHVSQILLQCSSLQIFLLKSSNMHQRMQNFGENRVAYFYMSVALPLKSFYPFLVFSPSHLDHWVGVYLFNFCLTKNSILKTKSLVCTVKSSLLTEHKTVSLNYVSVPRKE